MELEDGVLGHDLPSFFFLSFLYPEKTAFHNDLCFGGVSSEPDSLLLSFFAFFLFLVLPWREERTAFFALAGGGAVRRGHGAVQTLVAAEEAFG